MKNWIEKNPIFTKNAIFSKNPKDWKIFGLILSVILFGIGLFGLSKGSIHYPKWFIISGVILTITLINPKGILPIYIPWVTLAACIGHIITTLVLFVIFYGVLFFISLIAKLVGVRFLDRKWPGQKSSYWIKIKHPPMEDMSKQY